jgi:long-chain acyl-CoA synthetase
LCHPAARDIALASLHLGQTLVFPRGADPRALLQAIQEEKVTTAFLAPLSLMRLANLPSLERNRYQTGSLRWVAHAGAACPIEVRRGIAEWWGPILWDDYGCTECGCITLCGPTEFAKFPESVGRPAPGMQVAILDGEGNPLPTGQTGFIYMCPSAGYRFEYQGEPEKTQAAYRGDFFTVGDLGSMNDEGYLFLRGRKSDVIISGGINIYAAEVERALRAHPQVNDCAVFGIPDPVLGEAVIAAVETSAEARDWATLPQNIMTFLTAQLAIYKVPRRVVCKRTLPRNEHGKLLKRDLRAEYLSNRS